MRLGEDDVHMRGCYDGIYATMLGCDDTLWHRADHAGDYGGWRNGDLELAYTMHTLECCRQIGQSVSGCRRALIEPYARWCKHSANLTAFTVLK